MTDAALVVLLLFIGQEVDLLEDGGARDVAADEMVLQQMRSMSITLDLSDTPLTDFAQHLQAYTKVNFAVVLGPDANPGAVTINVRLTEVTVEQLLNIVLEGVQPEPLGWYVEDAVVRIVPKTVIQSRTTRVIYPLADLCGPGRKPPLTPDMLATLILDCVDKGNWEAEGRSLQVRGTNLVVQTTGEVHRQIARFLADLRAIQPRQVDVEIFFLAISEVKLREVRWAANRIKNDVFGELLKSAEAKKEVTLLAAGEVICFDGQKASAFGGMESPAPAKAAVKPPGASVAAPVQESKPSTVVRDGTTVEVRPLLSPEGGTATVEVNAVHALKQGDGMKVYRIGTTVRVALDQYVIAGGVGQYGEENRRVIVVVRAMIVE